MTVCFFGSYTTAEGYPVNRVLRRGLQEAGATVLECRAEVWGRFVHELMSRATPWKLVQTLVRMLVGMSRLALRYARMPMHDWVLIGYPGYLDVLLARWLIGRQRPIVLVSFISLFDTAIRDRGTASETSLRARLLKRLDAAAFRAADVVLVDTEAHGDYYAELFGVDRGRFLRSFVGEEDERFPRACLRDRAASDPYRVLFFGTYVPLHGVATILDAADLLRDEGVEFTLVGNGQEYEPLRERADAAGTPVRFVTEWQSSAQLHAQIASSDVCLGVFGTTPKAARVIPYKVFDALAVGRPVITRDSPAVRELLRDGESALLCPAGDGPALAACIRRLRDDAPLARRLAERGHQLYLDQGAPRAIGAALLERMRPNA